MIVIELDGKEQVKVYDHHTVIGELSSKFLSTLTLGRSGENIDIITYTWAKDEYDGLELSSSGKKKVEEYLEKHIFGNIIEKPDIFDLEIYYGKYRLPEIIVDLYNKEEGHYGSIIIKYEVILF